MQRPLLFAPLLIASLMLSGCGDEPAPQDKTAGAPAAETTPPAQTPAPGETPELEWDDLIPADWQPETLMTEYDADNLEDDDPRAQELMEKLKALWAEAPVVEELDGKAVRLPGFVVPLETDAEEIAEFLLVPYFGACIHVPPPPANQTVYVVTAEGAAYRGELFDTVWVEGRMRVEPVNNELGDAGYKIEEARVSLYEEPL
jgi:hypothetical protein